jgi:hypothetical protein
MRYFFIFCYLLFTYLNNNIYCTIFFGEKIYDKCYLINTDNGDKIKFIPDDYSLVNKGYYESFPEFLILKNGNNLFSYDVKNKQIIKVDINNYKKSETIIFYQSITEKENFILEIYEIITNKNDMMDFKIVNKRYYLLNAKTAKTEQIILPDIAFGKNKSIKYNFIFDSKFNRIFYWPSGDGLIRSIPLSAYYLETKKIEEVISLSDYNVKEYGLVSFEYNNKCFVVHHIDKISKITTVEIEDNGRITKNVFTINKELIYQINIYSALFIKEKKAIVFGGENGILIYNYNNFEINKKTIINDSGIYANFIFTDNSKIYYQSSKSINIINLDSNKIEKQILNDQEKYAKEKPEISLFN